MRLFSRYQIRFKDFLQSENTNWFPVTVFCKSLYIFLFVKIIFLWSLLHEINVYFPFEFTSTLRYVVYAPIRIAQLNVTAFLSLFLVLLLFALIAKLNYFSSILIFMLSFSLSRMAQPVANGSDMVLDMFLFLAILLPINPSFKSVFWKRSQIIFSNFALLLCQLQLAMIYLLSGYDKLISEAWRSGDAVYSIRNLDFFINPSLSVSLSESISLALAWVIILFELGFPFLIWFKQFRLPVLIAGIIFHLGIIFLLSLPDFGIVMMLAYTLFIPYRKDRGLSYQTLFN